MKELRSMSLLAIPHPRPYPIRIALLAMTVVLLFATGALASQSSKQVVKEAENSTLGRTVLTTNGGHTLYSLSVETKGRFICTGSCLSSWTPLLVPKGVKPKGPVKLASVKRPNGKTQVAYKGLPLYSFNGDARPDEANGEGLKDVGTWHAAKVGTVSSSPPPEPENPYPY
jgi:predicted lipoprotein with Yx(FWY)xxD motif